MEKTQEYLEMIRSDDFLKSMFSSYLRAEPYLIDRDVLDFGCGYGWGSYWASYRCRTITGYDIDPSRIAFAQQTCQNSNLLFCSDQAVLAPEVYQTICLFQVVAYLDAMEPVLKMLLTHLRTGGQLLFSIKRSAEEKIQQLTAWGSQERLELFYRNEYPLSEVDRLVEIGYRLP